MAPHLPTPTRISLFGELQAICVCNTDAAIDMQCHGYKRTHYLFDCNYFSLETLNSASIIHRSPKEAWVAYPNKAPFVAKRCKPFGVRHPSFAATSNIEKQRKKIKTPKTAATPTSAHIAHS
jgi:hypothetical protein